jgi:release factor glutamine methyltransferase
MTSQKLVLRLLLLCSMKTVREVFAHFRQSLTSLYGQEESEAITLLTVSEISGLSKVKIKAFPEFKLPYQQIEKLKNILNRLQTGEPIQYILGKTEFYGLPFYVDPSVLIPRSETEELVEWVISSASSGQLAVGAGQLTILDIGTGSGCIAIALKKNLPTFSVSAIDISKAALQTAKKNAILNNADIGFIDADILNLRSEIEISKSEIITSNPPYVTLHDKTKMHVNVTDFEPHNALFVPENDPLIFYKAIADFAVKNLTTNGLLFFEINESYGDDIVKLLAYKGFENIELRKDMTGRDRMIRGVIGSLRH